MTFLSRDWLVRSNSPVMARAPHINSSSSTHVHSTSQQWTCHQNPHRKEPRRPPARPRPQGLVRRRRRGGGGSLTPSTSTKSWSRSTLTPESAPRPCPSWTPSWMTSLRELLLRLPDWLTTTEGAPSPPERSRLLSVFCCQESWPSTPSLREPRLSPSTPAPSKLVASSTSQTTFGLFQGHQILPREQTLNACCVMTKKFKKVLAQKKGRKAL